MSKRGTGPENDHKDPRDRRERNPREIEKGGRRDANRRDGYRDNDRMNPRGYEGRSERSRSDSPPPAGGRGGYRGGYANPRHTSLSPEKLRSEGRFRRQPPALDPSVNREMDPDEIAPTPDETGPIHPGESLGGSLNWGMTHFTMYFPLLMKVKQGN